MEGRGTGGAVFVVWPVLYSSAKEALISAIRDFLGDQAEGLLNRTCKSIPKEQLHLPGADVVDRIYAASDRSNRVLGALNWLIHTGRLSGTGYLSILPVDQGIEHTVGASFAPNPDYFDPKKIVELALEGGRNAVLWGRTGLIVIGIGSLLAYATTGNAGILSASRSPLAMSHDGLLPARFSRIHPRYGTPAVAVLVTSSMMLLVVAFLSVEDLVKTASTMLLISLVLINISVIVMRHSRIAGYAPSFRMPRCPWLPGAAILLYLFLIAEMGLVPLLVTSAFLAVASIWYIAYVQPRIDRESAVAYPVKGILSKHIKRTGLEDKLVQICLERDEMEADRFDLLVRNAPVIDIEQEVDAAGLFQRIGESLGPRLNLSAEELRDLLIEREADSSTVIQPGLAIQHVVVEGEGIFELALVRCRSGAVFSQFHPPVHTAFVLIGSHDERPYHLRALVAIAHVVQETDFQKRWMEAANAEQLRDVVLLSSRKRG